MKKLFIVLFLSVFTLNLFAQNTNSLFEANKFSLNFTPAISSLNDHWGISTGLGYNLFKKTEIGLNLNYQRIGENHSYGTTLYAKYYFINRRFTPFVEFDNSAFKVTTTKGIIYSPALGVGLGYYGIVKHLAIEVGVYYVYPKSFGPRISLKWYF